MDKTKLEFLIAVFLSLKQFENSTAKRLLVNHLLISLMKLYPKNFTNDSEMSEVLKGLSEAEQPPTTGQNK